MKRPALFFAILLCCSVAADSDAPKRPRIFGIAGVTLFATDIPFSKAFYSKFLESDQPCMWCGDPRLPVFFAYNEQYVLLEPAVLKDQPNFFNEITFSTDSVPAMRSYLKLHNIQVSAAPPKDSPDDHLFATDPEGHRIGFTDRKPTAPPNGEGRPVMRIIHAGVIVKNRAVEDSFYKDALGFRVYWQGGMKDDQADWVDMQVPDGTDWLEYMLNVPTSASRSERGVMNHIALGVPDIESAAYRVRKNGVVLSEQPQIGRDGKWQLNLYDPDGTRVELMEFTPVQKPCCSEYTGPHPKP
jgi:catechol 2,3-dioxygenase-like lactoylglutathione lyase family enzyme